MTCSKWAKAGGARAYAVSCSPIYPETAAVDKWKSRKYIIFDGLY